MKILLTGATGFLGGAVLRKLTARGHSARLLVRDPGRAQRQFAQTPNIEFAAGDLAKPQTAVDALAGCDAVIHMAALVKRKAPRELFDLVNVTATELLLRAAWKSNIRAIYTSSFFALGPSDGLPEGRSPDSPLCTLAPHTDYERTKREADRSLEKLRKEGAPFITLYPGVLYGPGEITEANLVTGIIRDHFQGKVPGLPGGGRATWCYGYVDDVAEAHCVALERGRPGARLAIAGDNKTGMEFFVELQKQTGLAPPKIAVPIPVVWCAGAWEEIVASLRGREPKLTRSEALTYSHDWALDGRRGTAELGVEPTPLARGLAATLAWMRERDPGLFTRK